jgi:hypothetical protein
MRLAHVLVRPAVFVDGVDMHVAVWILCLELRQRAGDADRLAGIEVGSETVMREGIGPQQQGADDDGPGN